MPLKRLEQLETDLLTGSQVEIFVGNSQVASYQTSSGTVAVAGTSGYAKTAGTAGTAGTLGTGAGLTTTVWGINATGGTTIRLNFVNGALISAN